MRNMVKGFDCDISDLHHRDGKSKGLMEVFVVTRSVSGATATAAAAATATTARAVVDLEVRVVDCEAAALD